MKRTAPAELRSCSNLECGTKGVRSETCPRCGAPTFSDPNAREDPETSRRRRESLEALSPELLAQLEEIKQEAKEKDQISGRYVTVVMALVGVAVLLLIGGFIIARSRDEGGLTPQAVETAAQELLGDMRSGDGDGVCRRMIAAARETLAGARGATNCEQGMNELLAGGAGIPAASAIVDTSVVNEDGIAGVQSSAGLVQVPFVREDGEWFVSSADPVLTLASATSPSPGAAPVTPPVTQQPGQTTPGETTPGETTPGQTTPGQTTPGQTTPGETTPGQTTPTTPGGGDSRILEGEQQP